jgi:hypothetical protein
MIIHKTGTDKKQFDGRKTICLFILLYAVVINFKIFNVA